MPLGVGAASKVAWVHAVAADAGLCPSRALRVAPAAPPLRVATGRAPAAAAARWPTAAHLGLPYDWPPGT